MRCYYLVVVLYTFRICPKALKVVELTLLAVEDVNDDIDVVDQCPMLAAFCMIGFFAGGFVYCIHYSITDSFDLDIGACFAENEEVSNGLVYLTEVKTDDFFALLFLDGSNNILEKFAGAGSAARGFWTPLKGCDNFLQMKSFCGCVY